MLPAARGQTPAPPGGVAQPAAGTGDDATDLAKTGWARQAAVGRQRKQQFVIFAASKRTLQTGWRRKRSGEDLCAHAAFTTQMAQVNGQAIAYIHGRAGATA